MKIGFGLQYIWSFFSWSSHIAVYDMGFLAQAFGSGGDIFFSLSASWTYTALLVQACNSSSSTS